MRAILREKRRNIVGVRVSMGAQKSGREAKGEGMIKEERLPELEYRGRMERAGKHPKPFVGVGEKWSALEPSCLRSHTAASNRN